ncbi:Arabinose efflux permease family protein [Mesorhizobium prunaredense]|uniref:Arabinose efflux permease family protein n=1 Tax=Mesorhizobium prunaredense TaxID=1631249 RepID=A0A1R3V5U9_9HYPH|nr:MFS transporter [Mesorhizobium prunaredense]SIT54116.1 Arabinose efflux permease family protein [Mesorhizobium prunaredense]
MRAGRSVLRIHSTTFLFMARALRDMGDGFVAVLLPVYLLALGFAPLQVGIIATVSLLGSALLTIGVGVLGVRYDHRQLLFAAASLMVATGVAFAMVHDYALLLVVAFAGTINPSAGSVSVFVPLEHAVLTREVTDAARTKMFAHYSLVGALAAAVGALASATPDLLAGAGLDQLTGIKAMFVLYAFLGLLGGLLYAQIPQRRPGTESSTGSALGPSRKIVFKLAALFSLDAFAGGFVVQSLLALWLFEKFDLSLSEAGFFFFWSGVLSAFSFPVSAWLSRHIGLINTMVFTHIPSSIALMLAALAPTLPLALILLLIRAALSQMDVPTRSSYVMAVVTEAERAAAASFTSVPRSLAAAVSPALAGALFAASFRAWPLLICGTLKITYDLLLLMQFRHLKPPEER